MNGDCLEYYREIQELQGRLKQQSTDLEIKNLKLENKADDEYRQRIEQLERCELQFF